MALIVSISLSVGISYFGGSYFDKLAMESNIRRQDSNTERTLGDFADDSGDIYEIGLNVSIIVGFSVFVYYFINKKALYIRSISEDLNFIAGGNLSHRINVQGNNEISSLAESINNMTSALEKHIDEEESLSQSKQRLITGLSHDLRAPLSSIIGYLYVLRDGQYSSQDEHDKYLHVAMEKSIRLQKLLDDMLEIASLQEKDMKISTVAISISDFEVHFVNYIMIELQNICSDFSGVNTSFYSGEKKDRILLNNMFTYRVLDNLISNIYKYSLKNMPVEICVLGKEQYLELHVINHCDEETLNKASNLTERFFKVDSSRTSEDGSGLGLNISKEIMEKQNGYLKIESNNEKGQIIVILGFLRS